MAEQLAVVAYSDEYRPSREVLEDRYSVLMTDVQRSANPGDISCVTSKLYRRLDDVLVTIAVRMVDDASRASTFGTWNGASWIHGREEDRLLSLTESLHSHIRSSIVAFAADIAQAQAREAVE